MNLDSSHTITKSASSSSIKKTKAPDVSTSNYSTQNSKKLIDDKSTEKPTQKADNAFIIKNPLLLPTLSFALVFIVFIVAFISNLNQIPSVSTLSNSVINNWNQFSNGVFSQSLQLRQRSDLLFSPRLKPHNTEKKTDDSNYVVIIDAGSTGSRVHIYQFNHTTIPSHNSSIVPVPQLINETFDLTRPGLSHKDFISNFKLGAQSLDPLLKKALDVIPPKLRKRTPLSLKATAGLRLIGSPQLTQNYMRYLHNYLKTNYPFKIKDVDIMDGQDEAVYAWVTTNYLLGLFDDNDKSAAENNTAAVFDLGGASTQIVFEPDPAVYSKSLMRQILESDEELSDSDGYDYRDHPLHKHHLDHVYEMSLGSRSYRLYQHSHLGYGLMEARKKIHKTVLQNYILNALETHRAHNSSSDDLDFGLSEVLSKELLTNFPNPCIANQMERQVTINIREVLKEALTTFGVPNEQISSIVDYHIKRLTNLGLVKFDTKIGEVLFMKMVGPSLASSEISLDVATAAADSCIEIATQILNVKAECKLSPCSFNGVHQPSISETFSKKKRQSKDVGNSNLEASKAIKEEDEDAPLYIFSYFYDRTFPLGLPSKFKLHDFYYLMSEICAGPQHWDTSRYQSPLSSEFTTRLNNLSSDIVEELYDRPEWCLDLGFMYSMLHHGYKIPNDRILTIAKKINGHELGWCLGSAIAMLGELHEDKTI